MNYPTSDQYARVQGSPEGLLSASRGVLAVDDDTGRLFTKRTVSGMTGWQYQTVTYIGSVEDPNGSVIGYVGDTYVSLSGTRFTKLLGEGTATGWK